MSTSLEIGQPKHQSFDLDEGHAKSGMVLLRSRMEAFVEQAYWLRRQGEELALARYGTCAEARLIHLDLAGRYSVKADEEALWPSYAIVEHAENEEAASITDGEWTICPTQQALAVGISAPPACG